MAYPLLAAAAPIIAAGVQGLGNAISSNQSKGNDNIDFQDAMDWRNYLHQLEFAQKGIQWRTQDAIKAGLHPLAALGAQTTSFQPQQVFPPQDGGNKWSWLGDFGQNMSRAVMAAADSNTRRI